MTRPGAAPTGLAGLRRPSALQRGVIPAAAGLLLGWLASAAMAQSPAPAAPTASAPAPPPNSEEVTGTQLQEGGKPREALIHLDRAAASYRRAGDRLGVARVALTRSNARRALGELEAAARDAEEARAHSEGDPALSVRALTMVASLATDRSDFALADDALREALPVAERLGDERAKATVLRALGALEERRGRSRESLDFFTRSVTAADRSGDAMLRIRTRAAASVTLLSVARYDDALAMAQEGYDIADRAGVPALRAAALFELAQANAHVWNLDRAAELWTATIEASRKAGNLRSHALAQKQSVETWFALGEFDRAAVDGASAVELLRQAGLSQFVAETAARVALSEVRRGRAADARVWADRARAELPAAPESRHHFVHNDLGIVEAEVGDLARARADFARVLEVAERIGTVEYVWRAHWGFGRAAVRDRPGDAVQPLEHAIASVERLRQTIPEAGLRASFMINRVGPYETLVEAHMASASSAADDSVRRALEVAERARSRALSDLLAESRARLSDSRLSAVRDEETAFGRKLSAVQKRATAASDPPARAAALQELLGLEREYETLVVRIRRDNPGYAALTHPRALSAAELAGMLAPDEALIEFVITEKQGFAWVVRRDAIHAYRVPGRTALDPQVRLLTPLLAARDDRAVEQLGGQLYTSLLAPAEASLREARRLIIVPDGVLQRLPFALLRSNGRWLVETHTLALAPSATVLQFLRESRRARAPEPLLALAVPDAPPGQAALFDGGSRELGALTHAAGEVATAKRLVGAGAGSARIGPEATEVVLKSHEAGRYRILHFATHAVADEIVPRRSAVLLTPSGQEDGLLQVSEIANLSLNADLVVLAACRSHVGRLVRGEGLLGLSRAFIHAGARAVVATAWTVPDRETAWLMREFYTGLRDGLPPDEAVRRAQIRAIGSRGLRSAPGTWAAFVALGDARTPILDPVERGRPWAFVVLTAALVLGAVAAASWRRAKRGPW